MRTFQPPSLGESRRNTSAPSVGSSANTRPHHIPPPRRFCLSHFICPRAFRFRTSSLGNVTSAALSHSLFLATVRGRWQAGRLRQPRLAERTRQTLGWRLAWLTFFFSLFVVYLLLFIWQRRELEILSDRPLAHEQWRSTGRTMLLPIVCVGLISAY